MSERFSPWCFVPRRDRMDHAGDDTGDQHRGRDNQRKGEIAECIGDRAGCDRTKHLADAEG